MHNRHSVFTPKQSRFLTNWFAGNHVSNFTVSLWYRQSISIPDTKIIPLIDNGECHLESSITIFSQGPATIGNMATENGKRILVAIMVSIERYIYSVQYIVYTVHSIIAMKVMG